MKTVDIRKVDSRKWLVKIDGVSYGLWGSARSARECAQRILDTMRLPGESRQIAVITHTRSN